MSYRTAKLVEVENQLKKQKEERDEEQEKRSNVPEVRIEQIFVRIAQILAPVSDIITLIWPKKLHQSEYSNNVTSWSDKEETQYHR